MDRPSFTSQQSRAIQTTGTNILVSAAAGSGKTAVLAERCAYLVCEAPPPARCNADELLVLTFTESAAAEMRDRIVQAIKSRMIAPENNVRLHRQLGLIDQSMIGTVHSFCLWIIRRWFTEAGIDPTATVLDAEEAAVLRAEVQEALFEQLYVSATNGDAGPLQTTESGEAPLVDELTARIENLRNRKHTADKLEKRFLNLVDSYGLGRDEEIGEFVQQLAEYVGSLPDPNAWLSAATNLVGPKADEMIYRRCTALAEELASQSTECARSCEGFESGNIAVDFYLGLIQEYSVQVRDWSKRMGEALETFNSQGVGKTVVRGAQTIQRCDNVREEIRSYSLSSKGAPRVRADENDAVSQARDRARALFSYVRDELFHKRLRGQYCLYTVEEQRDGLKRIEPFVATIVDLVMAFRDAYSRRKRQLNVMDFQDLERLAFQVLTDASDPSNPSNVGLILRRRFAYVLVDEFQDINPLQQAILDGVARAPSDSELGNLFAVGDVKQSIYRFRLAEPARFIDRMAAYVADSKLGRVLHLQTNFRSRRQILDVINLIFGELASHGRGGFTYDEHAKLKPVELAPTKLSFDPAVELHVIERKVNEVQDNEEIIELLPHPAGSPVDWSPIEREAYLIGDRIREWTSNGACLKDGTPLRPGHVAVLLRAARVNAELVSQVLRAMGIRTVAQAGGSLFDAREIRDVLSLLQVLDNPLQDIPLAAVLRHGLVADRLDEDELVAIRLHKRGAPFYIAVNEFAREGRPESLALRVARTLGRIEQLRDQARSRPLSEVLWAFYEHDGFLATVGALPDGVRRQKNLQKLHDLSRRFGSFRRQGLHRFLQFVTLLAEREKSVSAAFGADGSDDAVNVMTIHQAKGLEFPVVFVAGLGNRFNFSDRAGKMVFGRQSGIGLRVVDSECMIEYSSVAHAAVLTELDRATREEEMRLLYVAMTRAREKLVLLGSLNELTNAKDSLGLSTCQSSVPRKDASKALCALDWMLPALAEDSAGLVHGIRGEKHDDVSCRVHWHDRASISKWRLPESRLLRPRTIQQNFATAEPLSPNEPSTKDDAEVQRIRERIDFVYPLLASASMRAAMGASEYKGLYDYLHNTEERPRLSISLPIANDKGAAAAVERGIATHRALQHIDFDRAIDDAGIRAEMCRLRDAGLLTQRQIDQVDVGELAWFMASEIAVRIRAAGASCRREFQFLATERPGALDPSVGSLSDDYVLIKGIVDVVVPGLEGLDVIDYKTDHVVVDQLEVRAERYRPQMFLYARALGRLWNQPIRAAHLVFLHARRIMTWPSPATFNVRPNIRRETPIAQRIIHGLKE